MAENKKNGNNGKKESASQKSKAAPKKNATAAKGKAQAQTPKKTAKTVAKAKAAPKKKAAVKEPKPPKKVMEELDRLARKHGVQGDGIAKSTPKIVAGKDGETKIAPPKNAKVKEVTIKLRYD